MDIPSYVITYARNFSFLILNLLAALPTLVAYVIVLVYFVTNYFTFVPCGLCNIEFLEVEDVEEQYVKRVLLKNTSAVNIPLTMLVFGKKKTLLIQYTLIEISKKVVSEPAGKLY